MKRKITSNDRHIYFLECSVGVNVVIESFIPAFSHSNQGHMREVLNKEDTLYEVHICGPSGSRLLCDEVKTGRGTFLDRPRGTSTRDCPLAAWSLSGFLQTGWKGNQRWAQFKRTQRPNAKQLQLLTSPWRRFNWPEQWNVNCGTCVVISKPLRVFLERESGENKTKTFGKVCERTSAGSALAHATRHRSVKSALIRSDMYRQIVFKHEGNSSLQKRSVSAHAPLMGDRGHLVANKCYYSPT